MNRTLPIGAPLACTISAILLLQAAPASAAPPLVDRGITLPRHDWAFDVGLGIGRVEPAATGVGLNVEGAVAVIDHLELGLRTGIRLGNENDRFTHADAYGRLFDRQTFGTYNDTVVDNEFRIRGALVHGPVVELALEGRAALPIERGSHFGMLLGMPLMFHLGHRVRLDTGVYVPGIFAISAPLDVWIQAANRLWFGPMTGVSYRTAPGPGDVGVSLGFGLGYSITPIIDVKAMFLFPRINEPARSFGTGAGVQLRIE